MTEDKGEQQPGVAEGQARQVQQALSLGWTLAEILGRWRRGITPPRKAKASDRLSFSSHEVLPGDELGMAAQRALVLAQGLKLAVPQPSEDSEVTLASLPDLVYAYMADPKAHPLPGVQTVRPVLEAWSRSAWIALAARSQTLATAFSLGGSLADTYWYMWPPGRAARHKVRVKETWRDLLSRQRMGKLIGQLRTLEESLPPDVVPALVHSLDRWGIAAEMERGRDGRLRISYRLLFAMRRFSWARRLRYNPRRLRWLVQATVIALASLSNLYLLTTFTLAAAARHPALFHRADEVAVVEWLASNATWDETVLAAEESGNWIAAATGQRVVLGHWAETVDYAAQRERVASFYAAAAPDEERCALLAAWGVVYVYAGPAERELGAAHLDTLPCLEPLLQRGQVTLYRREVSQ